MNGQQEAEPAPDKLDWESAWGWELIMPQLELPQAIHTPMSLHESNKM